MIDALILVCLGASMYLGYRRGAAVALLGFCALAAGALVGAGVLGIVADRRGALGAAAGALFAGIAFALNSSRVEAAVHERLGEGPARQADRGLGVVVNAAAALVLVWFVAVVLALVPTKTDATRAIVSSRVVDALLTVVTPTGDVAALVLRSGLLPALGGPLVIVDEPDDATISLPTTRAAAGSVVQMRGTACGYVSTGTGWVVARRLVVTNAHVVAGQRETQVLVGGREPGLPARIVAFDPLNDIAVAQVPSLELPPLPLHPEPRRGLDGTIVGFPRRDGLVLSPARFDRSVDFSLRDIYDQGLGETRLAVFRGDIRAGNSGSPFIDRNGQVVTTVTSSAEGQAVNGGYGVPNDVLRRILADLHPSASTGPCLDAETAGRPRPL